ncbi:MAG: zinc ABC transporter substrate-binding protein [Candidatus Thermoplasmatota archaeon]
MNKKITLLIISLMLLITPSIGCLDKKDENNNKINIVATFYPLAYIANEIGGIYVNVHQLIPDNTDVHNWQPSPSDIININKADIILYNGAGLDKWIEDDIIPSIDTTDKIIVETTSNIELLEKDQSFHNEEGEQGHPPEHTLYDPHTWISPYTAMQQAENIHKALITKDPGHGEYYNKRWNTLRDKLISIDDAYKKTLSDKQKDIIFVTHAAFGYLAHRYSFKQYGVIGLTADEQPSIETLKKIVDMMIENDTYTIYIDFIYTSEYAQTLKNTIESKTQHEVQILKLYLMTGVIDGLDYIEQLSKNLDNLKIGLQAT